MGPCWGLSDQKRKIMQRGTLGRKKISWVVILKCSCTLLRSEGSKVEDFGEKKPPKVEDWKSILKEILTFEKKTTKSGGFSSFDKKSKKKKLPKMKVFQVFVTKSGGF